MRTMIAVFERELSAKRNVWLLAAAVAAIAALAPLLPGAAGYDRADVLNVASGTLALAVGWGLALVMGASVFGGDLSAGRLGFFFARPVGGPSIWFGRMFAAGALVVGSEMVVLIPAMVSGSFVPDFLEGGALPSVIGYLVVPVVLLLMSNAAGIMLRARTPWLVLDVIGLVASATAGWLILAPLLSLAAASATKVVAAALVGALVVALVVGGLASLTAGRADLYRSHGALSLVLWTMLGAELAGIVAISSWLRDFEPVDFDEVEVVGASPDGQWVELFGSAPYRLDVRRRCLIAVADARWLPVSHAPIDFFDSVTFSADSSTAAWTDGGMMARGGTLWWVDLGPAGPVVHATDISIGPDASVVVARGGDRMAMIENGMLSVYDLGDERLLKAVRLPEAMARAAALFVNERQMLLIGRAGQNGMAQLRIAELDLESGRVTPTGVIDGFEGDPWALIDPAVEHLIAWSSPGPGSRGTKSLYRLPSGALVRTLDVPGFPRFMSDGRIAFLVVDEDRRGRLVIESTDGTERTVHGLGDAWDLHLGGEAQPGWLVLARLEDPADRSRGLRLTMLQVDTGERRVIDGSVRRSFGWFPTRQPGTGVVAWYRGGPGLARLFVDQNGALVTLDPDTGRLQHVVGGGRR